MGGRPIHGAPALAGPKWPTRGAPEPFRSSPELFRSFWNFPRTSYLCTLATRMFPKHYPSVVKTLSVLPSVREHSGHGRDPPANDRQGALDDYNGPRAF